MNDLDNFGGDFTCKFVEVWCLILFVARYLVEDFSLTHKVCLIILHSEICD